MGDDARQRTRRPAPQPDGIRRARDTYPDGSTGNGDGRTVPASQSQTGTGSADQEAGRTQLEATRRCPRGALARTSGVGARQSSAGISGRVGIMTLAVWLRKGRAVLLRVGSRVQMAE